VIEDGPAAIRMSSDLTPVEHAKPAVPIVLGFQALPGAIRGALVGQDKALRPVQPEETAGAAHLILTDRSHRIMDLRARQGIVPGRWRVVEIGSGILSHVEPSPPQVQVKLVGVPGSGVETGGAKIGPGRMMGQTEGMGLMRRKGFRGKGSGRSFASHGIGD
jgi:hypothetical protein